MYSSAMSIFIPPRFISPCSLLLKTGSIQLGRSVPSLVHSSRAAKRCTITGYNNSNSRKVGTVRLLKQKGGEKTAESITTHLLGLNFVRFASILYRFHSQVFLLVLRSTGTVLLSSFKIKRVEH